MALLSVPQRYELLMLERVLSRSTRARQTTPQDGAAEALLFPCSHATTEEQERFAALRAGCAGMGCSWEEVSDEPFAFAEPHDEGDR